MAKSTKQKHGGKEGERNGSGDNNSELSEYDSLATVECAAASKSGDGATEDADAHF